MMAAVQPKLLFSPLPREALHHESENPVAADHRGPDCAAGGIQLEHAGRALRRVAGRDRSPGAAGRADAGADLPAGRVLRRLCAVAAGLRTDGGRSEEHTSELQSPCNLVCRLLLEKKKKYNLDTIVA